MPAATRRRAFRRHILFDGRTSSGAQGGDVHACGAGWKVENGCFTVLRASAAFERESSATFTALEWSSRRHGTSQMRGNSGVLFMQRYEIQVLDAWNTRRTRMARLFDLWQYAFVLPGTRVLTILCF